MSPRPVARRRERIPFAISAALALVLAGLACGTAAAEPAPRIPATPLMTVYRFNGPREVPTYDVDRFLREGPRTPSGSLTQGSSVVPCLVVRNGKPLTDRDGTPFVGFEVVVDAARATPASATRFTEVLEARKNATVEDHRCPPGVAKVIDVRVLHALASPPRFEPPAARPWTRARPGVR